MKGLAKYHGALMLYWLVVFFFHRLFFIFYQWPVQHKVHSTDQLILALFEGYRLDLSTATILLLLPLTLTLVFYITRRKAIQQGIYLLVSVLLFLYCLVGIGDAGCPFYWYSSVDGNIAHFNLPAAGGAAELGARLGRGESRRGFALLRPPGHHAERARSMGFCIFNSVAIAAKGRARSSIAVSPS